MNIDKSLKHNKILIIESNPDELEILQVFLESQIPGEILPVSSAIQGIEKLKNDKEINLVICNHALPGTNGDIVYRFIKSENHRSKFILMTNEKNKTELMSLSVYADLFSGDPTLPLIIKPLSKKSQIEVIKHFCQKINKIKTEDSTENNYSKKILDINTIEKFAKLSIEFFLKHAIPGLGIHILLGKNKFIKIVSEEELKPSYLVMKYQNQGLEYIYLTKEDFQNFIDNSYKKILKNLEGAPANATLRVDIQFNAIESFHQGLKIMGIRDELILVGKRYISSTLQTVKDCPDLIEIMKKAFEHRNFIYKLSMLTTYIAVAIAKEDEYLKDSSYEILALSALAQDLSLEDETLSKITSLKTKEFKILNENQKEIVLQHPFMSVDLIDNIKSFPAEVRTIVLEHHERPDGNGFPRKHNQLVTTSLCCTFNLANEIASRILNGKITYGDLHHLPQDFVDQYSKGNYKKPLKGFIKAFKKL